MSRTIFCTFLQREADGQDFSCIGRAREAYLQRNLQEAWAQWQHKQTMLINEKKLSMMNPERKLLEMVVQFLFEGKTYIEGYAAAKTVRALAFKKQTQHARPE
jgi:Fe-S cluster biosynthesis and repair protein YggX